MNIGTQIVLLALSAFDLIVFVSSGVRICVNFVLNVKSAKNANNELIK